MAATIDCAGTIVWTVAVGDVPDQSVKVDAIEPDRTVTIGFVLAATAGTYVGESNGFDTSVAHQIRFQRIAEGKIQEQVSLIATDSCLVDPRPVDTTPPSILVSVDGALGEPDWYVTDVTVTFDVIDLDSAVASFGCEPLSVVVDTRGVSQTCTAKSAGGERSALVTIKRDATPPTLTCSTGVAGFQLGQAGAIVSAKVFDATSGVSAAIVSASVDTSVPGFGAVELFATDLAGVDGSVVCEYDVVRPDPIDVTPPVVTAVLAGQIGGDGWHVSDVGVTWSLTDPESDAVVLDGCVDTVVADDTPGLPFSCTASSAGGVTTFSTTVRRDVTPPTLTCVATAPFALGQTGAVVSATVTDATSGPTVATIVAAADTSTVGTRTVVLTGTDRAGNTTQQPCTYSVVRSRRCRSHASALVSSFIDVRRPCR